MTRRNTDPGKDSPPQPTGARLDAPAFHRNIEPILVTFSQVLTDRSGHVLEIGSGTGQHITRFAATFSTLHWWPSDPDPANRASISAWASAIPAQNLHPPIDLNAAAGDWGLGQAPGYPPSELTAIVCCNVFHIAPWEVTQGVINGAARHLADDGILLTYGPYQRGGEHTAPSNASFDTGLRAHNPAWGVRDIADIEKTANAAGLHLKDIIAMPANNMVLVIVREDRA